MGKVCEYFFAPHSHFAYLGHARFVALAKQYNVQVTLKPFDLNKIFGLPMNLQPSYFPVQSDYAARLIIANQLAHGTNAALDLTDAVMRAIWEKEKNIADTDTLLAIVNTLGHDGLSLLKSSETASVQAEFDRFSEKASAANVFGAPWYAVDGEGYWGQDRLDFVERAFVEK